MRYPEMALDGYSGTRYVSRASISDSVHCMQPMLIGFTRQTAATLIVYRNFDLIAP